LIVLSFRWKCGEVFLDESVFGLAKGQFAVFYDGDKLIGSGEIE